MLCVIGYEPNIKSKFQSRWNVLHYLYSLQGKKITQEDSRRIYLSDLERP
jgi:hypothetical protein